MSIRYHCLMTIDITARFFYNYPYYCYDACIQLGTTALSFRSQVVQRHYYISHIWPEEAENAKNRIASIGNGIVYPPFLPVNRERFPAT